MDLKEAFLNQLKATEPLLKEDFTEEDFQDTYTSGRKKEVGDIVLFAWIVDYEPKSEENSLSVIQIHPDELEELYEIDYSASVGGPIMPTVKRATISE